MHRTSHGVRARSRCVRAARAINTSDCTCRRLLRVRDSQFGLDCNIPNYWLFPRNIRSVRLRAIRKARTGSPLCVSEKNSTRRRLARKSRHELHRFLLVFFSPLSLEWEAKVFIYLVVYRIGFNFRRHTHISIHTHALRENSIINI